MAFYMGHAYCEDSDVSDIHNPRISEPIHFTLSEFDDVVTDLGLPKDSVVV